MLDTLARRLAEMEETMRRDHERAAHREQVIDRLHAENQDLRHGLLEEALNPIRAALYRLYDTARREAARWRDAPASAEHAASLLDAMADEVAEVLGRAGAERMAVNPGDAYDPVVHRPMRIRPVRADADGTVVEVLADGFAGVARGAGGAVRERVVRKAGVVVGRASPEGRREGAPDTPGSTGSTGSLTEPAATAGPVAGEATEAGYASAGGTASAGGPMRGGGLGPGAAMASEVGGAAMPVNDADDGRVSTGEAAGAAGARRTEEGDG